MTEDEQYGRDASREAGKVSASEITIGTPTAPVEPLPAQIGPVLDQPESYKPSVEKETRSEAERWVGAGFNPVSVVDVESSEQLQFVLPEGMVALRRCADLNRKPLVDLQKAIGLIPNFRCKSDAGEYAVYRLVDGVDAADLKYIMPVGVDLITAGMMVPLPYYQLHFADDVNAKHIGEIVTVTLEDIAHAAEQLGITWPPPEPDPIMRDTPLLKHSLQGQADALEKLAKASRPLLGHVCLSGQATVWYAPPNSGKTLIGLALIVRAIRDNLILSDNVYVVNADDNGTGLAEKLRILQDVGAHMLVPGFRDFRAAEFQGLLLKMAQTDKARGVIVIIDTIKKFASLMDKRDISGFADTCRQFVMHGGTILAFAHTNKNATPNGALKYAGTTDLVEDFDAAYIISPLETVQPTGERIVRFECIKRRGDSPDKAAYAYSTENGLTYEQLLASVEEVTFDKLGEIDRDIQQRTDAELIEAIKVCIGDGIDTKMQMAAEVAKRTKTSGKSVIRLIDRYTGDDPAEHHWAYSIGERGKHIFYPLAETKPSA